MATEEALAEVRTLRARVAELEKVIRASQAQCAHHGANPLQAIVVRHAKKRIADAHAELDRISARVDKIVGPRK